MRTNSTRRKVAVFPWRQHPPQITEVGVEGWFRRDGSSKELPPFCKFAESHFLRFGWSGFGCGDDAVKLLAGLILCRQFLHRTQPHFLLPAFNTVYGLHVHSVNPVSDFPFLGFLPVDAATLIPSRIHIDPF